MDKDDIWMQRALDLARLGSGFVAPNPMVGCVLVKNDQIIGEGWHATYGQAHAEVAAINSLPCFEDAKGSTAYVSLEPCSHTGKTPPCADLLIRAGLSRVVICNIDPNPLVSGQGIQKLTNAGIEVLTGILEEQGLHLNRKFFHAQVHHRPYFTLKFACSQDQFIAARDGKPLAFSNQESQVLMHQMRAEHQGILIGVETAIQDNPQLTIRFAKGKNPIRIVIDPNNRMPQELQIIQDGGETWIFTKEFQGQKGQVKWIALGNLSSKDFLMALANSCFQAGLHSILIEGGSKTAEGFHQAGLLDDVWKIEKTERIMEGIPAPNLAGIRFEKKWKSGKDNEWYQGHLGT
jgi:diaminohydroxyphosphoribosylaminopyrimidine deaminase/5-amino-6-(5-phosphoribosylamino)uracil reductase